MTSSFSAGRGKSLIALLDGTLDSALISDGARSSSHVYSINVALEHTDKDGRDQVAFYFSGVGSQNRWKIENKGKVFKRNFLDSARSYYYGATAEGIEQQIADCYVNLSANYQKYDKIYIFGYSRGAVAAKVTADIIERFGLLKADCIDHFSELWSFINGSSEQNENLWKKKYCREQVPIDFLGLFDTVCGYLSPRQASIQKMVGSKDIPPCVKRCVHLLSIDEKRKIFTPTVFNNKLDGSVIQIWVPGGHGDIGGTIHDSVGRHLPLLTMIWHLRTQTRLKVNRKSIRTKLIALLENLKSPPQINSIMGYGWSMLGKRIRTLPTDHDGHFAHPILRHIEGFQVRFGQETGNYNLYYHPDFFSLPLLRAHERIWQLVTKDLPEGSNVPVHQGHGPYETMVRSTMR